MGYDIGGETLNLTSHKYEDIKTEDSKNYHSRKTRVALTSYSWNLSRGISYVIFVNMNIILSVAIDTGDRIICLRKQE